MDWRTWLKKHKKNIGSLLGFSTVLSLVLCIFLLTIAGATFGNENRLYKLDVECVDLDGGMIGQSFLELCHQFPGAPTTPSLVIRNFSSFADAKNGLLEGMSWGMMVVNPNATSNFLAAFEARLAGQNVSYDATSAMTFLMDPGRNSATVTGNILPFANVVMQQFQTRFAETFWKQQFAHRPMTPVQLVNLTSLIVTPISHTVFPISAINSIGLVISTMMILLLSIAFVFLQTSQIFLRPMLSSIESLPRRMLLVVFGCICCTAIISLGWSAPLAIYSGASGPTFLYFWMTNWSLQLIVLTALVVMTPLLGKKLVVLFFAIFLLANLAGGPINITVAHPFYSWAWVTPAYHCLVISRYVLFGGHNPLSISLSVLLGMLALNFLLIPCVMVLNLFVLVPRGYGIAPLPLEEDSEEDPDKEIKEQEMKEREADTIVEAFKDPVEVENKENNVA